MAKLDADLLEKLALWRRTGKTIVFTNGVFDLLHPGHLAQLKSARACGDVLIVGLNGDSSVKELQKGEGRPIMDQVARRAILEELRCVDAVAVFDEETPIDLITLVMPEVLVKGADYEGKEVVGRSVVEANGGRVELVPLLEGYSTSAIIKRINASK